ncbi:hypothetical protein HFV04_018535 [Pseudomonas sp. BIGb0427]|uniref:hypothetical protein n=1 Tax=unclassified Pseudomonas TaxID=196821 RepID=UPI0018A7B147|nr:MULTISPECIES: hypothetical protein [unclassified Pseudomonas]QPG61511.1 hypothetical protein HFV04_018535 [Pseudomonas sp. BIGb0427]UVL63794.1 hypothetical protein LOY54_11195 [Pseudomonas sp. B21-032]UVM58103.1 hypothetical protein LOY37_11175 [Pseudomonas sp. B21-012]UVM69025.1 hypothetical protein LOY34_11025 [Pseudomonas sp. B21-009]
METNKGMAAIVEWRARFLGEGRLQEAEYDRALMAAQQLEQSGRVSPGEWVAMVRQANAALLGQR